MSEVRVDFDNDHVATIRFGNADRIRAILLGAGFEIQLPFDIQFTSRSNEKPIPVIDRLRADISVNTQTDGRAIGFAFDDCHYEGNGAPDYPRQGYLRWIGGMGDLKIFSDLFDIHGTTVMLGVRGECRLCIEANPDRRFYSHISIAKPIDGTFALNYPRETWIKILRDLGVADIVVVEVPIPNSASPQWEPVFNALQEARTYYEQGAATGWSACAGRVRFALEQWQKIEKESMGPGWQSPTVPQREARTPKERIDNLRWHLLQIAHQAPHTSIDSRNREEAGLLLTTLSSLLALRLR